MIRAILSASAFALALSTNAAASAPTQPTLSPKAINAAIAQLEERIAAVNAKLKIEQRRNSNRSLRTERRVPSSAEVHYVSTTSALAPTEGALGSGAQGRSEWRAPSSLSSARASRLQAERIELLTRLAGYKALATKD